MDLETELNEITKPVEGSLILTPDNSIRTKVTETLTHFFSSTADSHTRPQLSKAYNNQGTTTSGYPFIWL